MTQSTVFKTNKTQAIRVPKALAFPDHVKKVKITKLGNGLFLEPVGANWDDFFNGPRIDDNFLSNRDQPPPQEREDWE